MYICSCVLQPATASVALRKVLNLELCLPCIRFFTRFNLLGYKRLDIIIYSSWFCTPLGWSLASRLFLFFLGFFSFFFLSYLLRSYNYIRKYAYLSYARAGWYYFEFISHNVSFVTWLSIFFLFIVTIPKYRGTMDTNFFSAFLFRAEFCDPRFFPPGYHSLTCCLKTPRLFAAFKIRRLLRYHRLLSVAISARKLSELKWILVVLAL